jgi:hypothetical protein
VVDSFLVKDFFTSLYCSRNIITIQTADRSIYRINEIVCTDPVRQQGKLGSRLGPPIFRGRQFNKIRAADF